MSPRSQLLAVVVVAALGCTENGRTTADGGAPDGAVRCQGTIGSVASYCGAESPCCHSFGGGVSTAFCCAPGTQCCVVRVVEEIPTSPGTGTRTSACAPADAPCPTYCWGSAGGPTCPAGEWCLHTGGCTTSCEGRRCGATICCAPGYYCQAYGTTDRACVLQQDAGVDVISD